MSEKPKAVNLTANIIKPMGGAAEAQEPPRMPTFMNSDIVEKQQPAPKAPTFVSPAPATTTTPTTPPTTTNKPEPQSQS